MEKKASGLERIYWDALRKLGESFGRKEQWIQGRTGRDSIQALDDFSCPDILTYQGEGWPKPQSVSLEMLSLISRLRMLTEASYGQHGDQE